jgi:signal transduction histidine kinase
LNRQHNDTIWIERLDQIFSGLRHELGNDLHALKLTLDHLNDNFDRLDDREKMKFLGRLSDILMRQERLVASLESYLAVDIGTFREVDVSRFFERIEHKATIMLKRTKIVLNCRRETATCAVWANDDALETAIVKIIENAIETLSDAIDAKIDLDFERSGRYVIIRVADNGPGIDSRNIAKVFLPFFSTKKGKIGMGLPVARKLLAKMNGKIAVANRKETGTEASIWIKTAGVGPT